MPKDDKAALDIMDADLAKQKIERARITKTISDKEKADAKLSSAMDRFHAMRSKYTNFAEPAGEEEGLSEVISEKKSEKKLAKKLAKPHTKKHKIGRHTKAKPHFEAPPSYSAVPDGETAKTNDAKLAAGADADENEDWKVHKETYRELHPEAFERKKKPKKKLKRKTPTPLKDAEREEHHAIETIHSTKKIIAKEPKRLTLKEAKKTIADRKKRKAAPMKISTKYVHEHTKMSMEC